jgi:hypothetical protein
MKIIKIEMCEDCPNFTGSSYCFQTGKIIEDQEIIHPDCPLEDFPNLKEEK